MTIQKQGSFAVGGKILGDPNRRRCHCDHGYVDYQIPVNPRRTNLVMWHSAAATAWLNRWDGGEGYQSIFLRRGYPGLHLGRPARRPRQLGLHRTHLQAGHWPRSGKLRRLAVRTRNTRAGSRACSSRPRTRKRGTRRRARATSSSTRSKTRSCSPDAAAKAAGQDRPERRAHQFRRRHARHPAPLKTNNMAGIVMYENVGYVYPQGRRPGRSGRAGSVPSRCRSRSSRS